MLKKIVMLSVAATGFAMAPAAFAMTGVFVDGNVGYANQSSSNSIDFGDPINLDQRDRNPVGWMLGVGYNYDITEEFGLGVETGYADYNKVTFKNSAGNQLENKQSALFFLADATWHINPLFDVIGKAGFAYTKASGKADFPSVNTTDSNTQKSLKAMLSVGAGWNIMPALNLHVNWDHIFGSALTTENLISTNKVRFQTVDAFWAGVKYTFNV